MELIRIFIALLLMTSISHAGIIRTTDISKVEEKQELKDIPGLVYHFSDAAVEELDSIAKWQTYMKKRNKILKILYRKKIK